MLELDRGNDAGTVQRPGQIKSSGETLKIRTQQSSETTELRKKKPGGRYSGWCGMKVEGRDKWYSADNEGHPVTLSRVECDSGTQRVCVFRQGTQDRRYMIAPATSQTALVNQIKRRGHVM